MIELINGNAAQPWPAAEKHYRKQAAKYVVPTIAYAQQMAGRPWYSADKVQAILQIMRTLEDLRKLYTGPINRSMEEVLEAANGYFRTALKRLDQLDR